MRIAGIMLATLIFQAVGCGKSKSTQNATNHVDQPALKSDADNTLLEGAWFALQKTPAPGPREAVFKFSDLDSSGTGTFENLEEDDFMVGGTYRLGN